MEIQPYLMFNGDCAEAMEFYANILDGEIKFIQHFRDAPPDEGLPPALADKVMHARLEFNDQIIMASDDPSEDYKPPAGINLQIDFENPEDAQRIFDGLAEGGSVMMKIQPTPYAKCFGMVTDKFGVTWMLNCWNEEYA